MLLGQILRNTFTIWNQSLTSTLIYFELSRPCICCTLKNVFICPSSFCHLCRLPQFGRRRVEILYTDLSMLDFELPRVAKKKNSNISAPRQNFKNLVFSFMTRVQAVCVLNFSFQATKLREKFEMTDRHTSPHRQRLQQILYTKLDTHFNNRDWIYRGRKGHKINFGFMHGFS